jgi:predicted aconitase with swiveling domain
MRGRIVFDGKAEGLTLVSSEGISFYGGVDPETGVVTEAGHPLAGRSVAGRILVFPQGKGSTVGSYTLYRLAKNGVAPAGIINRTCETVVAVGAIIAEIPCVDSIPWGEISDNDLVTIDGAEVRVERQAGATP